MTIQYSRLTYVSQVNQVKSIQQYQSPWVETGRYMLCHANQNTTLDLILYECLLMTKLYNHNVE